MARKNSKAMTSDSRGGRRKMTGSRPTPVLGDTRPGTKKPRDPGRSVTSSMNRPNKTLRVLGDD